MNDPNRHKTSMKNISQKIECKKIFGKIEFGTTLFLDTAVYITNMLYRYGIFGVKFNPPSSHSVLYFGSSVK